MLPCAYKIGDTLSHYHLSIKGNVLINVFDAHCYRWLVEQGVMNVTSWHSLTVLWCRLATVFH